MIRRGSSCCCWTGSFDRHYEIEEYRLPIQPAANCLLDHFEQNRSIRATIICGHTRHESTIFLLTAAACCDVRCAHSFSRPTMRGTLRVTLNQDCPRTTYREREGRCLNGFLGLYLNDRTILTLVALLDKTGSDADG